MSAAQLAAEHVPYEVIFVAHAIVYATSTGLCAYGKVCPLCDCFADRDGGKYRDEQARIAAAAALARYSQAGA